MTDEDAQLAWQTPSLCGKLCGVGEARAILGSPGPPISRSTLLRYIADKRIVAPAIVDSVTGRPFKVWWLDDLHRAQGEGVGRMRALAGEAVWQDRRGKST